MMGLNDIVASALNRAAAKLNGATVKLRRNAILYGICAVCALAMLILAVSASLLALEPHVGMIYARLIMAGVFALVLAAIVIGLWLAARPAQAAPAQVNLHQTQAAQRSAQFAQLAMIVEAVMLGYSMARRR